MENRPIYKPLGHFRINKSKIKFEVAAIVPVIKADAHKHRKITVEVRETILIKSDELPAILFVIGAREMKHGGDEPGNRLGNLRNLPNSFPQALDYAGISIKDLRQELLSNSSNLSKILIVIFHSDHEREKIEKCFNDYYRERKYVIYTEANNAGGVDFAQYYKDTCETDKDILQPETSGGAILVGV